LGFFGRFGNEEMKVISIFPVCRVLGSLFAVHLQGHNRVKAFG
jgi:hypothetical protein